MSNFAPIFVVGHARSGTTLMAHLLSRNPEIASTPETNFVNRLRFAFEPFYRHGIDATVDEAFRDARIQEMKIDREMVKQRLRDGGELNSRTLLEALLETYREQQGKPHVAEKSPGHLLYIPIIASWYPKARFVWIVRDGRACIASLRKVNFSTHALGPLSRRWSRNIAYLLRAQSQMVDRMYALRFEDLVEDTETTLRGLHDWLGIPFSPLQLQQDGTTTVVPESEKSWKGNVGQPIMANRSTAWSDAFTRGERDLLDRRCGVFLERLGYEVPPPGWFSRLAALPPCCSMGAPASPSCDGWR